MATKEKGSWEFYLPFLIFILFFILGRFGRELNDWVFFGVMMLSFAVGEWIIRKIAVEMKIRGRI